jgi:putative transposase
VTLKVSERRACRALGQHRSTQRKPPRGREDEEQLTADLVELARQYGRYGYRKIAALLRRAGWLVNDKRVERIDPAELHRLYPTARASDASGGDAPSRTHNAAAELTELRAHLADAIRVRDETIEDLRHRLDIATQQLGEALQQVKLLTDQRAVPPAAPVALQSAPRQRWWLWRR